LKIGTEVLSDTGGVQLGAYFAKVLPAVKARCAALLGAPGVVPSSDGQEVNLLLTITSSGQLAELRLEGGGAGSSLAKSAWEAARDASYAPLPTGLAGSQLKLRLHFAAVRS
jgi:hypothetical protein